VLRVLAQPDASGVRADRYAELRCQQNNCQNLVDATETAAVDLADIDSTQLQQLLEDDAVLNMLARRDSERRDRVSLLREALDKLAPSLRTAVMLRDIRELSYQEIVDLLKIPEGTVKSRINRGRIELAKILKRMKVLAVSEV